LWRAALPRLGLPELRPGFAEALRAAEGQRPQRARVAPRGVPLSRSWGMSRHSGLIIARVRLRWLGGFAGCRQLCRFLDAGNNEAVGTLSCQASKKRQGTKSREVGHRLGSERYGDLMSVPSLMVGATLAGSDRDVWTGEGGARNGHLGKRSERISGRSAH
jgi:hypothetical protein